MSRYELEVKPSLVDTYTVAVGWDRPLNTFFAQVLYVDDDRADEEGPVLNIGGMPEEIHDIETIFAAVKLFAIIPDDMYAKLYADANS